MKQEPLQVLIVGCGNIAGMFDMAREPNSFPYTHAGAYSQDNRFSIAACVDPDIERRLKFMDAWGIKLGFDSIDLLMGKGIYFDVISICSPTKSHPHDLDRVLRLEPKLIFCEKPVSCSVTTTLNFVEKCRKLNILFAVNYTRRWDPDIVSFRDDIFTGKWGNLRAINGVYNKGLLNNGSHMINLLQFLLGELEITAVGKPRNDFFLEDPTVDVWLKGFNDISVHLVGSDARDYSMFELQFIFSKGVLTMENGGLNWCERFIVDSNEFSGYRTLDQGVHRPGRYVQSMSLAIDNIYRAITRKAVLASTGESALITQRICDGVLQKSIRALTP